MEPKEAAVLLAMFSKDCQFDSKTIENKIMHFLIKGMDILKELDKETEKRYHHYLICCNTMDKVINSDDPEELDGIYYEHIITCNRCRNLLMEFSEIDFRNIPLTKKCG